LRLLDERRVAERTVGLTVTQPSMAETASAFDAVAGEYHATNSANPILRDMRRRTLAVLGRHVARGSAVLDLGCGPGTDQEALLGAGYTLTAIDVSVEMVAHARRRAETIDAGARPTVLCCSIEELSIFASASFDAAFSNFGPLNCVSDLREVAGGLHRVLRRGGVLVASVIGRVCPWEIALYLARGDLPRVFTRFHIGAVGVPLKAARVWTRYYVPSEFARAFAPAGFRLVDLQALGAVSPPPYLEGFAGRHGTLTARLLALDEAVARWPVVRSVGDHFLIVLQRD
jgi:ubiquinone/menaquinone biosynthesis C-methylase UbiE